MAAKRHPVSRLVLIAAIILMTAPIAHGDVRILPDKEVATILIDGRIKQGDAIAFKASADALAQTTRNKVNGVPLILAELDSGGGDVAEAEAIGRVVRARFIETLVKPTKTCASACVFVLMAGVMRSVADDARIGIHRPQFDPLYFAGLSPGDARAKYDGMLASVGAYFDEIGAPKELFRAMVATSSSSIRFLSKSEIEAFSVRGGDPAWEELSEAGMIQQFGVKRWPWIKRCWEREGNANANAASCVRRAHELYPND